MVCSRYNERGDIGGGGGSGVMSEAEISKTVFGGSDEAAVWA
jgi:hypothetical protein